MKLRLLKTKSDYEAALAETERLVALDPKAGTAAADRLDLLALLVETYEKSRFPLPAPTPLEAIHFRMEQMGLRPADLVPDLGSRAKVSEVFSGKRRLSLKMIRNLHRRLGIPAEVLINEPSPRRD